MEYIIAILELVVQKAKAPLPKTPPPYTQRIAKQNSENQFKKFIQMMKSLSINVLLVEDLEQIPGYTKFMKDLMIKKWSMNFETIKVTHQVSEIVHPTAPNLDDLGAFMIPCTIGSAEFAKVLCDLGANFVTLDFEVDYEVSIILGRSFLATGKALCDVKAVELTLRVGDEKVVFRVCKSMRQPNSNEVDSTLAVLQKRKRAIGWTLADIRV
ncbi:uncharacterized protein [Nicotiana tomentosiformis]|uniref:uncharacterized protein n=1 Tax=Nicotiana tomentosiformis TaxID=4098 RepID=UPI00388CCBAF